MPRHDAPYWRMDPKAVALVALKSRVRRKELEHDITVALGDLEVHDRLSFASEVIAAQLNLLADKLRERREVSTPEKASTMSASDYINAMAQDVVSRALLRRVRGEDL